jgi:hypothetical protein
LRAVLASAVVLTFGIVACDGDVSLAPDGQDASPTSSAVLDGTGGNCTSTGTGLSAVVVNQDLDGETVIIGDCDVGAFFDEDGVVKNATFKQEDPDGAGAGNDQFLVRVEGADVDVTGSEFDVTGDYKHQIIHVGLVDGASGNIAGNELTGFKRVGILLRGEGTSAEVQGNALAGVGPKTDGWAENGIQVSGGATAIIKENTVEDHWWDMNDFVSSGIIVFGSDGVTVQRNSLAGNDAALVVAGDDNNFIHNTVDVTDQDGDASGIFHAGAIVSSGENNGLRQNDFISGSPAGSFNFGIFVAGAAVNTKLIRNSFDGNFADEIVDQGDETKLPDPFDPDS